jgi:hypothetical protein
MAKSLRFIIRLSIVALIFFSLQGEVMVRYADMFQAKKQLATNHSKKSAEQQHLVKLQSFTQKIFPLALPPETLFTFNIPAKPVEQFKFPAFQISLNAGVFKGPSSPRGPPSVA